MWAAVVTHTHHDGRDNFVAGGDISLRLSNVHTFNASVLKASYLRRF